MTTRSRRQEFLDQFLGALGAEEIIYSNVQPSRVDGTVLYDLSDPEERQDFCWQMTEDDIPSRRLRQLVRLLNEDDLLSIDKIILTRSELLSRYNIRFDELLDEEGLVQVLTELGGVYVDMVDDGVMGDGYFIHE